MILDHLQITGRVRTHVTQHLEPRFAAIAEVADAFLAMREAAAKDGFDLEPFSSFRDFKTQLRIWNKKFKGEKPLYDINGKEYDPGPATEDERIDCILNWSALPGGSRHQWGTEIDVIDRAAVGSDYRAKLLPEEIQPGGVFHSLHQWLDEHMPRYGFFRPYAHFQGGMFPEPWHLSYAPISQPLLQQITPEMLLEAFKEAKMCARERVIERLPELFENHVLNIVPPNSLDT